MPADAPRRVFRPSPPNYVIGWVLTTFCVLLGLALALGAPRQRDWVGPEIMGVVLLLGAVFSVRAIATSVLVATPAELVCWPRCSASTHRQLCSRAATPAAARSVVCRVSRLLQPAGQPSAGLRSNAIGVARCGQTLIAATPGRSLKRAFASLLRSVRPVSAA
jgi:hypothetical protein